MATVTAVSGAFFILVVALPVSLLIGVFKVDASRDPVTGEPAPRRPNAMLLTLGLAVAGLFVAWVVDRSEALLVANALGVLLLLLADFATGTSWLARSGRRRPR
jgi:hypothetical protein